MIAEGFSFNELLNIAILPKSKKLIGEQVFPKNFVPQSACIISGVILTRKILQLKNFS